LPSRSSAFPWNFPLAVWIAYAYVSLNPMSYLHGSCVWCPTEFPWLPACKQPAHKPSESIRHRAAGARAEHRPQHAEERITSTVCARTLTESLAHRSHHHCGNDRQHAFEHIRADAWLRRSVCGDLTTDVFAAEDVSQDAVCVVDGVGVPERSGVVPRTARAGRRRARRAIRRDLAGSTCSAGSRRPAPARVPRAPRTPDHCSGRTAVPAAGRHLRPALLQCFGNVHMSSSVIGRCAGAPGALNLDVSKTSSLVASSPERRMGELALLVTEPARLIADRRVYRRARRLSIDLRRDFCRFFAAEIAVSVRAVIGHDNSWTNVTNEVSRLAGSVPASNCRGWSRIPWARPAPRGHDDKARAERSGASSEERTERSELVGVQGTPTI